MKYIHEVIGGSEKKKILEVGAGTGRYSIALAREGHQVDGLEYTIRHLSALLVAGMRYTGISTRSFCIPSSIIQALFLSLKSSLFFRNIKTSGFHKL